MAVAGQQRCHGPLIELSPQHSTLSSPTLLAARMGSDDPTVVPAKFEQSTCDESRPMLLLERGDTGTTGTSISHHRARKRSAVEAGIDIDLEHADEVSSTRGNNQQHAATGADEKPAPDLDDSFEDLSAGDSSSDNGCVSAEMHVPDRKQRNAPATPDLTPPAGKPRIRIACIEKFRTEAAIEQRMDELRHLYRQNLIQYRKITAAMGCRSDPPFHKPADRRQMEPTWEYETTRRSRRHASTRGNLDDDEPGRKFHDDYSPPPKSSHFSTKPTPEEIVIDANGHKSYRCLLCPRRFTHPPAFSQHKRSHGRELAEAAAAAQAADSDSENPGTKETNSTAVDVHQTDMDLT